ncbi:MAG TPA: aminotransferase class IV, partial [Gemmatimonas sp.]|nr:aminotransferase class IV [Gemmatimonas sp.]
GITREVIIGLAGSLGIPVSERAFTLAEALLADECFMTSATSFVLPVTRVDERMIAGGSPGPCTIALRNAYLERAEQQSAR